LSVTPRHELVELRDLVVGDALEDIGEPGGTDTSVAVTSTGKNAAASRPGPNRGSRRHRNTMFAFSP